MTKQQTATEYYQEQAEIKERQKARVAEVTQNERERSYKMKHPSEYPEPQTEDQWETVAALTPEPTEEMEIPIVIKGFTPLIHVVLDDVGLSAAAVFGRVWRYSQGQWHVCKATWSMIGKELGLSDDTVGKHIKTLCEHGYLEDKTPTVRNHAHVIVVTDKVNVKAQMSIHKKGDPE